MTTQLAFQFDDMPQEEKSESRERNSGIINSEEILSQQREKLVLICMTLEAGVPLAIDDLRRRGGPNDDEIKRAKAFGEDVMACEGDAFLYNTTRRTASIMNECIRSLAVMSFFPSGVSLCGLHFEVHI